jgi:hypothetical protein
MDGENCAAPDRPIGLTRNPSTDRKKRESLFPNKSTEPSFAYGSRVRSSLTLPVTKNPPRQTAGQTVANPPLGSHLTRSSRSARSRAAGIWPSAASRRRS